MLSEYLRGIAPYHFFHLRISTRAALERDSFVSFSASVFLVVFFAGSFGWIFFSATVLNLLWFLTTLRVDPSEPTPVLSSPRGYESVLHVAFRGCHSSRGPCDARRPRM